MERLTSPNINVDPDTDRFLHATIGGKEIDWKQFRDSTLNVLINGPTSTGFGKDIFRKMARDLYGRLKAYEDIAELCGGFDRLRELAEADKDGRVVVLPCKVYETDDQLWGGRRICKLSLPQVPLCSQYIAQLSHHQSFLHARLKSFNSRGVS